MNLNLNLLPVSVSFVVVYHWKWSRYTVKCASMWDSRTDFIYGWKSGRGVLQICFQINYAWQKSPVKPWKCTNVDIISNVCDELLFIFWLLVVIILFFSFYVFVLLFLSSKMVSRQRQIHYDYWLVRMDTKIFYDFAYSHAHTNTRVYNFQISGSKRKSIEKKPASQITNQMYGAQALLLKLIAPILAIWTLFRSATGKFIVIGYVWSGASSHVYLWVRVPHILSFVWFHTCSTHIKFMFLAGFWNWMNVVVGGGVRVFNCVGVV